MTFCTYEQSVLAYADHQGNLSRGDAAALLSEHGFSLPNLACHQRGISWAALAQFNAEALLSWLGY